MTQSPLLEDNQQGGLAQNTHIGGPFVVGDILPEILEHTPNQVIDAGSFTFEVKVGDVEGIDQVWATVMPPDFISPEVGADFETPVVSFDRITFTETDEIDRYLGQSAQNNPL